MCSLNRRKQVWFYDINIEVPNASTFPRVDYSQSPVRELKTSLSNNDDHGSENITKKMNLRPFKLYRVYLEPFNSSNVSDFSWRWILKGFIHVEI